MNVTIHETESRDEWLELRRTGIGGSDASVIMGANPYKTPEQLRHDKLSGDDTPENEAMRLGTKLERPVMDLFAEKYGLAIVKVGCTFRSIDNPFMLANVDGLIVEESEMFPKGFVIELPRLGEDSSMIKPLAILEIKTAGLHRPLRQDDWKYGGVPNAYEWQGCHYSEVLGIPRVYFGALVGGSGLQWRERVYSDSVRSTLVQRERAFWEAMHED